MKRLEPASFEVERFALAGDDCLEVRGRWFGVRGRRFVRPALTAVAEGRKQRILAALEQKPWSAEEGEDWIAVFPFDTDPADLIEPELTVAPDVTVPLPPPSTPAAKRTARLRGEDLAKAKRDAAKLRAERDRALAARDAEIDARHAAIEEEVGRRIAGLRAEVERERAGAQLAAQTARERDDARAARDDALHARDEAAREREQARSARDNAMQERNRMLAQRDAARTRVEEATRQWEQTAALGTQRTLDRDAVIVERDRLTRELYAARDERDSLARERDAAFDERDAAVAEDGADQETLVFPAPELGAGDVDVAAEPRRAHGSVGPGLRRRPGELRPETVVARAIGSASGPLTGAPPTAQEAWRARVLAASALVVVLVVLLVMLLAK